MPRRTKYRLRRKKIYNTKRRRFRGGDGDQVSRYSSGLQSGYGIHETGGPWHTHRPGGYVPPPEYVPPIDDLPPSLPPFPHGPAPSAPPLPHHSRGPTHIHIPTYRGVTLPDPRGKLEYYGKSR